MMKDTHISKLQSNNNTLTPILVCVFVCVCVLEKRY